MLLAFAVLLVLAWHVWGHFDLRALARQIMTVALATLTFLVFWNGDAWVAQANVDRYARTGKIDVQYLTRDLSLDAYPTLVEALPSIAQPERAQLATALSGEYVRHHSLRAQTSWYEWNVRRERARSFVVVRPPANTPAPL
jgi:two-component system, OmpR family, sensor histidine kinase BaeS